MKTLLTLASLLVLLAACRTNGPGPSADAAAARPEVRYYVIADT
jgi:hypothetical protein